MGDNPIVDFPSKLCKPIAEITSGFTFAYLQELFVASLLDIAHRDDDEPSLGHEAAHLTAGASLDGIDVAREDLERYKLWRAIKRTVKVLRHEIDGPHGPDKDKLTGSTKDGMNAVANASARGSPIPCADEDSGEPEADLVSDEQIDKMLSRLWQHENKSYFTTSPPATASPALYRPRPDARLHPALAPHPSHPSVTSHHARMGKAYRAAKLARNEGDLVAPPLLPFARRRIDDRIPR